MPVQTRNMRKKADLPALPPQFPVDVPNVKARPRPNKESPPNATPAVVPRASLPIVSPEVLSSPTRLGAPSPVTPSSSRDSISSEHSSRSSASSTLTQYDPPFAEVHPGVRKLNRLHQEGKWNLKEYRETVRMCPPSPLSMNAMDPFTRTVTAQRSLNGEWSFLSEGSGRGSGSARARSESISSEATVHGAPSVASNPSTISERQAESAPRVTRRQVLKR
ncbi:hypothetical protein MSAN_01723300 [Mycena sanguinolenta]|uniref:Uncharacterized protein n=1 Tax=Mycena sanguinolenta TaxID=230812 RepID=A0A8H6XY90_9AGAR|nr:hypothetical protein MSAN_01723300 [Mycena sanguinolenta]